MRSGSVPVGRLKLTATPRQALAVLLVGSCLSIPERAAASGSYAGGPPKPPATVDAEKYHLGKQIFTAQAHHGEVPVAAVPRQRERLTKLQARLPKSARDSVDLTALPGQLSPSQIEALEYYLWIRFKIRIDPLEPGTERTP